jgi:hypothetical protein
VIKWNPQFIFPSLRIFEGRQVHTLIGIMALESVDQRNRQSACQTSMLQCNVGRCCIYVELLTDGRCVSSYYHIIQHEPFVSECVSHYQAFQTANECCLKAVLRVKLIIALSSQRASCLAGACCSPDPLQADVTVT